MPLAHLECDLCDDAAPALLALPTLLGINNHTASYVRTLHALLCRALAVWRHPHTDALPRPDLRNAATACGSVRYLALPCCLTRGEAEAFCRYYGGVPVCPATAEDFHALYDYPAPFACITRIITSPRPTTWGWWRTRHSVPGAGSPAPPIAGALVTVSTSGRPGGDPGPRHIHLNGQLLMVLDAAAHALLYGHPMASITRFTSDSTTRPMTMHGCPNTPDWPHV